MLPKIFGALTSLIACSIAARDAYPMEVPAKLVMDLTGLNSMSRVLWLECQGLTKDNAVDIGDVQRPHPRQVPR